MDYSLGIDIGSTTVKVAVIDSGHKVLFSDYQRHYANIKETLQELLTKARAQVGNATVHPTVTGSGGMAISEYLHIPFCQEVVCVSNALQDYELTSPSSWAARTPKSYISPTASNSG